MTDLIIERDGPVTTFIRTRSAARNAMNPEGAKALHEALLAFEADSAASVGVLYGAGGAFCAGFDLKHAAAAPDAAAFGGPLDIPDGDTDWPRGPMGPTRLMLSKPVIAAIAGPAVAGGMEIALWCDLRVMEEDAYMGVYCRRWGVPLIDGGTVRLPRIVGQGRALDLILTGRKVEADEALRIGLADRVVPKGTAREAAEALAHEIARFPQGCMRADRASTYAQWDMPIADALRNEWRISAPMVAAEGVAGAGRFAAGKGRGGDFGNI
ncbi:crotonase/enoyl-CoA hydratase family protein [Phreatobacter sp. AB_2022a]|uniref:crotonase/enoyl-CoA hydratase family protein n=1 Tax=Phreatobacter sp. AB_2022a TaxID=3003134 RepID=UPI0022873BC3|nr:crotonase/enoyl-CoA hydratase family protein [Phreatobacter sp. AB_2022a]MCZ0737075.1 crotonase/enoyl-CoA hydratase family protein [Phreatobacter sp. AB_2022a]